MLFDYVRRTFIAYKYQCDRQRLNSRIALALHPLDRLYKAKTMRFEYICSCLNDAIATSAKFHLNEIERQKAIIDNINSYIYGAIGERLVVKELQRLPDNFILINNFSLTLPEPIYNRRKNQTIQSIQIDHLLVSPSGIFLIETKNWNNESIQNLSLFSPVEQIQRFNYALFKVLNGQTSLSKLHLNGHHWGQKKVPIKNLIVLIKNKPAGQFQHVKILTLDKLISYVTCFEECLSSGETQIIADYLRQIS